MIPYASLSAAGSDGPDAPAVCLELRGVSFQAGPATLLDNVDLVARRGEVLAVVGPNGAGKSTLLRLLARELQPTTGEVFLHNKPMHEYGPKELAKRRAVLPQQTVIQFAFSAFDVVMMGRNPHLDGGWPGATDRAIAEGAMARTQTLDFRQRIFPGLSGGEQSRVTLARVLAQETPVLLLDEPTASLDVKHQELAMQTARSLASEGACVVVIVHDLNLASAYASRLALLHRGRLAACGAPNLLLRDELLSEVFECRLRVVEDGDDLLVVPAREAQRQDLR